MVRDKRIISGLVPTIVNTLSFFIVYYWNTDDTDWTDFRGYYLCLSVASVSSVFCFHLDCFKKGIRIFWIKLLIYPENGIKLIIANIGDIMSKPYRHVNKGWLISIQFKR
jgi:hypothetical protein